MKLKLMTCLALSALLLCGCETDAPLESIETSANILSETLEDTNISKKDPIRFSERDMEDFIFEASCYETRDGETIRYRGEILDQTICKGLWEIICMQETMQVYEGGSCSRCTDLVLTDKVSNEKYYVGYSIWYENPENEGGPKCFVVSGADCGNVCYEAIEDTDDMLFVSDVYKNLLMQGVKTPENIVSDAFDRIEKETEQSYSSDDMFSSPRPVIVNIEMQHGCLFSIEKATLIDSLGNVYSFAPSDYNSYQSQFNNTAEILVYLYENTKLTPTDKVNENTIKKCMEHGSLISRNAYYTREESDNNSFVQNYFEEIAIKTSNWSSDSLYYIEEKTLKPKLLMDSGYNKKYLHDPNAKIIRRYFEYTQGNYHTYTGIISIIEDLKWIAE